MTLEEKIGQMSQIAFQEKDSVSHDERIRKGQVGSFLFITDPVMRVKRTVSLTLHAKDLGFWSPQTHQWAVEPGVFDLWMGEDSTAAEHATFSVVP